MTSVPIGSIIIRSDRRPIKEKIVIGLMDSIKDIGLLNAITVLETGGSLFLVTGLHRLEACKRLGWETIPVQYFVPMGSDKARVELAEIDENLIRNELTVLEQDELLARRKVLYEGLHPQTVKGKHDRTKEKSTNVDPTLTFIKNTATTTGKSESAIQRSVKRAKNLTKTVKEKIKDTSIADNKEELTALAKVPKNQQGKVVDLVLSGEKASVRAATAAPVPFPEAPATETHTLLLTDKDKRQRAHEGAEQFLDNINPAIKKAVIDYQRTHNNQCPRNRDVLIEVLKAHFKLV